VSRSPERSVDGLIEPPPPLSTNSSREERRRIKPAKVSPVSLSKFNGDVLEYPRWSALFDEMIHYNDTISTATKANKLLECLVGEPREMVRDLLRDHVNYRAARSMLKDAYYKPELVRRELWKRFKALKAPEDNVRSLKQFVVQVKAIIQQLLNQHANLNHQENHQHFLAQLPQHLLLRVTKGLPADHCNIREIFRRLNDQVTEMGRAQELAGRHYGVQIGSGGHSARHESASTTEAAAAPARDRYGRHRHSGKPQNAAAALPVTSVRAVAAPPQQAVHRAANANGRRATRPVKPAQQGPAPGPPMQARTYTPQCNFCEIEGDHWGADCNKYGALSSRLARMGALGCCDLCTRKRQVKAQCKVRAKP